jgi:Flp pilus assembly protein TadB
MLCEQNKHEMGDRMGSKQLYLLTIFYIVVFAILFKWLYPEVRVTALSIVIALFGFIVALGSKFLINLIKQNRGKDDGK